MNKNNKNINGKETEALESHAAAKQEKCLTPFLGLTSIALSVAGFAVAIAMHEGFVIGVGVPGFGYVPFLLSCLIAVISVFFGVIGLNRKEPPIYSAVGIIAGLMMLTWFAVGKW